MHYLLHRNNVFIKYNIIIGIPNETKNGKMIILKLHI